MSLQAKVRLLALLPIVMASIIGLVFITTFLRTQDAREKGRILDEVVQARFALSVLAFEYLQDPRERIWTQWQMKHDEISALLGHVAVVDPRERVLLERIRQDHATNRLVFSRLVTLQKESSPHKKAAMHRELAAVLANQLLIREQAIISDSLQLTEANRVWIGAAQRRSYLFAMVAFIALTVAVAVAAQMIARNIKAMDRRHQQAERKFRGLLESAPDAIVVTDRSGRVVLVNVQTERLFGYDRNELVGQPVEILIPERFRALHVGHLTGYVNEPRIRPMGLGKDLHARRKDGSEFPTAISLSPVGTGDDLAIFTDIRDVTEQRQIEQRVKELNEHLARRNVELEALNKELESFSYSVSHDLRAPLRSIDGFSQALIEDCADKLDERGQTHLARVRAASQRMAELIDDLLQLSRVTRKEMRYESVDLSALAREILSGLQRSQPERPVETRISTGLTAHGDPHLLRILLENLLSNAWKFTGKSPHSLIEFGTLRGNNDQPVFYVRDNGVGFDMAYADKLFGAFQRLHAPSEFPGTGIGLATTQRIVNRHGGRVWTEAKTGEGATFYFTL